MFHEWYSARSPHKAGYQPPTRNVVDHREFLGDHERVIHQRQRAPEYGEAAFRAPRKRAGDEPGVGIKP